MAIFSTSAPRRVACEDCDDACSFDPRMDPGYAPTLISSGALLQLISRRCSHSSLAPSVSTKLTILPHREFNPHLPLHSATPVPASHHIRNTRPRLGAFSSSSNRASNTAEMDISRLLQLQTTAAYQSPTRPQPQPAQDSASSRTSSEASSSGRTTPGPTTSSSNLLLTNMSSYIRCSRCQRSLSIDSSNTSHTSAVQYGTNCYYCNRCARMVGFTR